MQAPASFRTEAGQAALDLQALFLEKLDDVKDAG